MELYKDILSHALTQGDITVTISNPGRSISDIVEGECYQALKRIQEILTDDSLKDSDCFAKIEEIICTLESIGSHGGNRHDFG